MDLPEGHSNTMGLIFMENNRMIFMHVLLSITDYYTVCWLGWGGGPNCTVPHLHRVRYAVSLYDILYMDTAYLFNIIKPPANSVPH